MLVTLADMKSYLGISGTDYDTFLTQQITMVSDTIEAYCRRTFSLTTYTQTFYLEDYEPMTRSTEEIQCFHYPITSVTSVKEKYVEADAGIDVATTEYRIHKPSAKIIKNRQSYPFFTNGYIVEVTYEAGYAAIPTPITQVVYNLVQERYNKKANGIDLNFGSDVEAIAIAGVMNIQYDFSLQSNKRNSAFGAILGNSANILDAYRSERAVVGTVRLAYL